MATGKALHQKRAPFKFSRNCSPAVFRLTSFVVRIYCHGALNWRDHVLVIGITTVKLISHS